MPPSSPRLALFARVLPRLAGWLFLLAWFSAGLLAQSYTWRTVEIGGGGFVTGTIFHPTEPNLVYARTDVGGIYRLDPATDRWIPLNNEIGGLNNEFQHHGVLGVGLDPNDPDRLYMATGQYSGTESWKLPSRLYRSTDRGNTWLGYTTPGFKMAGNGEGRGAGERLAVSPDNGAYVFAGSGNDGLWRSTNHGATWSKLGAFPGTDLLFLLFAPANASPGPNRRLYASARNLTSASLWHSDDLGATWVATPGQPGRTPGAEMFALQGSFDAAGVFYVTWANQSGPGNYPTVHQVAKLSADRTTWTPFTLPGGQGFYAGVSADPRVPGHVVVSTCLRWYPRDEIYRSTNGGATWTEVLRSGTLDPGRSPWSSTVTPHWITDVDIDPFDSNRVFFNTGYGLFATGNLSAANASRRWTFFNYGLEELVPLGLYSPAAGPPLFSVVGDYTGFRHDNLNRSPRRGRVEPGDGSTNNVRGAALAPNRVLRYNSRTAFHSADAGATWSTFPSPPAPTVNGVGRLEFSADGSSLLWCPVGSPAYRSTDNGATWSLVPSSAVISSGGVLTVSFVAGAAGVSGSTTGTASASRFSSPAGIAVAPGGTRYVADTANHTLRRINADESTTLLAGSAGFSGSIDATGSSARFSSPSGLVFASGALYVADTGNHTIRKVTTGGITTTFAGLAGSAGSTDAFGPSARFQSPAGLAADSAGNLYVADTGNHVIRKISPSGAVTTLAGGAGLAGSTNATGASARFNSPRGLAVDSSGNVFVADTGNHVIRKITSAGVATTWAGLAGTPGTTNGAGTAARFSSPRGLALDPAGNLHVADTGNHTLRRIDPAGVVSSVAGSPGASGTAEGTGTTARFLAPGALAGDPDGINYYVADTGNHTVRRATAHGSVWPLADSVDPLRFYLWDPTGRRLLTSTDAGATFAQISGGHPSAFSRFRSVLGKPGHLWVGAGSSGLYRSTNYGGTFTKNPSVAEIYQFGLGAPAPGATAQAVYIWGKINNVSGLYRSDNEGATWVRINDSQHQFGYLNEITGDARTHGRVYLATSGLGVVVGELDGAPAASRPSEVIYADSVLAGWNSVPASGVTVGSTALIRRGASAIAGSASAPRTITFTTPARSTSGYAALSFWLSSGASAPPPLQIGASRTGITLEAYPVSVAATPGWQRVVVPLSDLGLENIPDLTALRIESRTVGGVAPGAFAVDDVVLLGTNDFAAGPPAVTLSLASLTTDYDGNPKPLAVTTTPPGLPTLVTYNGSPTVPNLPGHYTVDAYLDDPIASASASATLVIRNLPATLSITSSTATATGAALTPTFTTVPAGLPVAFVFNGAASSVALAGIHSFSASIDHPLYEASASGVFTIVQPALTATGLTGWASNIEGKVTVSPTAPSSPLLNPNDTTDAFSTNTLQSLFSPITLVNPGDRIVLTGGLQLSVPGVASQGNWFRFGLYDNRGQAPGVATGWLGCTGMVTSLWERTSAPAGTLFSSGSGATQRNPDSSPAPVSTSSAATNPPLAFEVTVTRSLTGVVITHLLQRLDTTPATTLMRYSFTDTTPNNNGSVSAAQSVPDPTFNPTYTAAGFAFARTYIATTGATARFTDVRVAFSPGAPRQEQTITFPPPGDRTLGDAPFPLLAAASSGLPVSFSIVSGPATLAANVLTLTGAGAVTVRASQTGDATYSPAPVVERTFQVAKTPAGVSFTWLAATYDGLPKDASAVTTPPGLTLAYTYDGAATAPTDAGSYTVEATIENAAYAGSATATFVIGRATQAITFPTLEARPLDAAPLPLAASASSGLPVTFELVSGLAELADGVLTPLAAGPVVVRAVQAGGPNHLPASAEQTLVVTKATATLVLGQLLTRFDGRPKSVSVTTTPADLPVTVTYAGSAVPPAAVGSYAVVATVDDANYAGTASATLVIDRRAFTEPVTGWLATNSTVVTGADTASPLLNAGNGAGTSGASVPFFSTFTPRTLATVGDSVRMMARLTVNTPAGTGGQGQWFRFGLFDNPNAAGSKTVNNWLGYTAMAQASATNNLYERVGGTSSGDFASSIFGTSSRSPDAAPAYVGANSPTGVVSLLAEQTITRTSTGVTVVSRVVRPGVGGAPDVVYLSSTYTDSTPNNNGLASGGSQTVPASPVYSPRYNAVGFVFSGAYLNSANTSSVQFAEVETTFTPGADAAAQSITFAPLPDRTYGDAPFALAATASSGLPVAFSVVSGPAALAGGTLTLTGVGPVIIRGTQAGDVAFLPAVAVEQTFLVAKLPATVNLGDLTPFYTGDARSVTVTTTPPGLAVEVTYDDQPSAPFAIGDYTVSAVVIDPHYEGRATATFAIQALPQSITFDPIPDQTLGTAPLPLVAISSSGLPVEFSVVSGPATIAADTLTLTGVGSVTVRASQPGGDNFGAAEPVERTFSVRSPLTIPQATLERSDDSWIVRVASLDAYGYQLQRSFSLADDSWNNVGPAQVGQGAVLVFTDASEPEAPRRFYRVVITPSAP